MTPGSHTPVSRCSVQHHQGRRRQDLRRSRRGAGSRRCVGRSCRRDCQVCDGAGNFARARIWRRSQGSGYARPRPLRVQAPRLLDAGVQLCRASVLLRSEARALPWAFPAWLPVVPTRSESCPAQTHCRTTRSSTQMSGAFLAAVAPMLTRFWLRMGGPSRTRSSTQSSPASRGARPNGRQPGNQAAFDDTTCQCVASCSGSGCHYQACSH